MIRIPIETVQEQADDPHLLSQLAIAALLTPLSMTFITIWASNGAREESF